MMTVSIEDSERNFKNGANTPRGPTMCIHCGQRWYPGHMESCPIIGLDGYLDMLCKYWVNQLKKNRRVKTDEEIGQKYDEK